MKEFWESIWKHNFVHYLGRNYHYNFHSVTISFVNIQFCRIDFTINILGKTYHSYRDCFCASATVGKLYSWHKKNRKIWPIHAFLEGGPFLHLKHVKNAGCHQVLCKCTFFLTLHFFLLYNLKPSQLLI